MRAFFTVLAMPLTASLALVSGALLFDLRGPLVALLLNAFLLFEVGGLSQVYALPMPPGYFRPSPLDRRWVYERLGIKAFKRLMRSRLYRRINPDFHLTGGRSGLADLETNTRSAEAAHALLFIVVSAIAGGALLMRWFDAALWLTLFNVLLNGYPVMLQRYNRLRLEPLIRRR